MTLSFYWSQLGSTTSDRRISMGAPTAVAMAALDDESLEVGPHSMELLDYTCLDISHYGIQDPLSMESYRNSGIFWMTLTIFSNESRNFFQEFVTWFWKIGINHNRLSIRPRYNWSQVELNGPGIHLSHRCLETWLPQQPKNKNVYTNGQKSVELLCCIHR
jgi:hypothetical protein